MTRYRVQFAAGHWLAGSVIVDAATPDAAKTEAQKLLNSSAGLARFALAGACSPETVGES